MGGLTLTALIILAVNTCVTGYIGYAYAKTLQKEKFQDDYRLKAKIVAELFALWFQGPFSKRNLTPEDFSKLNQLAWECSFWLPERIILDINKRLNNAKDAKDVKEILVDVREYLNPVLGRFNWEKIVHF